MFNADQWLDQFKWKNRVILVFSTDKPDLDEYLEDKEGSLDRDLKIFWVSEAEVYNQMQADQEPEVAAEDLRRKFDIDANKISFLLIGKDGGVKLRESKVRARQQVFDLIDSMPMRRREMEKDGN